MNALITTRIHKLSDSLVELKQKVREALTTELATAVGTAVRDIIVVTMLDRMIHPPPRQPATTAPPGVWRQERDDRWAEPRDPWADEDERPESSRYELAERNDEKSPRVLPATTALAVGVQVGRWWLGRNGSLPTAVGFGILATTLGFAGGPFAHAALAVLAAATDLLTAESAVARPDPS
jgi:hypothetical protein